MRTQPILRVLLVILGFACGCAVGPNYKRPAVNVPPTYRGLTPEEAAKSDARSLADEKWWEVFQDEQLKELAKAAKEETAEGATPVAGAAAPAAGAKGAPAGAKGAAPAAGAKAGAPAAGAKAAAAPAAKKK